MDRQLLARIARIDREIQLYKDQYARLQDRLQPGAQNLDGMPHGTDVGRPAEQLAVQMADLAAALADKITELEILRAQALLQLAAVPDSITRQCIALHYIQLLPWDAVAAEIGAGYTAETCRQRASRALRAEKPPGD